MSFEIGWFVIAATLGLGIGALLLFRQRPRLSRTQIALAVAGSTFALYYIMHVVFGAGRTGWP